MKKTKNRHTNKSLTLKKKEKKKTERLTIHSTCMYSMNTDGNIIYVNKEFFSTKLQAKEISSLHAINHRLNQAFIYAKCTDPYLRTFYVSQTIHNSLFSIPPPPPAIPKQSEEERVPLKILTRTVSTQTYPPQTNPPNLTFNDMLDSLDFDIPELMIHPNTQ